MTSRTWADGPSGGTPITAANLNGIEADITANATAATAAQANAETYTDNKDTANRTDWAASDTTNYNNAKSYADNYKTVRGTLANTTDLNTLTASTHHGAWALTPGYTFPNAPAWLSGVGTLVVQRASAYNITHTLYDRDSNRVGRRHVNDISPTPNTFKPWVEIVGPNDISTAVAAGVAGVTAAVIPPQPTTDWVHWGDSLTDNLVTGADAWVTKLAALTGANHLNEGWYGQVAAQIAARQGGNPAIMTVTGASIPASGTAVLVTAATPHVSMPAGVQETTRQVPGMLAGRTGYIYYNTATTDATAYFMPTDGAASSAASGVQTFVPTGDADLGRTRVMTICAGENDIWATAQTPAQVAYMVGQMIDYQKSSAKRVLILSIPRRSGSGQSTGAGIKTQAINDALSAAFPTCFIDVAGYLMSAQAATDAAITYTTQDQADIADGVTPTSFRLAGDSVHWNATACSLVANYVYAAARGRGWV